VYFNIRNILPKSGRFLLGHPVYIYIYIYIYAEHHLLRLLGQSDGGGSGGGSLVMEDKSHLDVQ
jgi:hypothetical protein